MISCRALVLALAAPWSLAGCVGEAGVRYAGSVVSATSPGYSFDVKENPDSLAPLAGAEVRLCVCRDPCSCADGGVRAQTDAMGHYGDLELVFPGFVGVDTIVVVRASADGFSPVTYTFNFDKRSAADRAREPSGGDKLLNFRLAPARP